MRPVTIRKCRRAYTMMRDNNSSLGAASKAVGTTPRSLKKFFGDNKINIKRKEFRREWDDPEKDGDG